MAVPELFSVEARIKMIDIRSLLLYSHIEDYYGKGKGSINGIWQSVAACLKNGVNVAKKERV